MGVALMIPVNRRRSFCPPGSRWGPTARSTSPKPATRRFESSTLEARASTPLASGRLAHVRREYWRVFQATGLQILRRENWFGDRPVDPDGWVVPGDAVLCLG